MREANVYYVYQGCINGTRITVQPKKLIWARGPLTAMKEMFPNITIRKATKTEIYGKGDTTYNWVQLNHCNKDEAYYFILE